MKRIFYIIMTLLAVGWIGCKEEGRLDHIDDSSPAPAQVLDVTVRDIHGGAVLYYKLPNDENLLYVKAEYEIQPGVMRETKSSYFKDSLVVDGFGDTRPRDVLLYSVGKNEKMSEPLRIQINPLTPPVQLVSKQMRETFGGVAIDLENPESVNLAIVLRMEEDEGQWIELQTFYTSLENTSFSFRGLDSIPYNFAVHVRDRWNNLSDTIEASITPWYEEYIVKNTWREYLLPDDAPAYSSGYPLSGLWNEVYTGQAAGFQTTNFPLPHAYTWDLGVTVQLSRFKYWPRDLADDRWIRGHIKVFELYGSAAPYPSVDDGSWVPLGQFESIKPSGDGPQITQDDIDLCNEGLEFDFVPTDFAPDPQTPIRYIRMIVRSTFGGALVTQVGIAEISFWGAIIR